MYEYDAKAASKSEGGRITQTCKVKGMFTSAYKMEANERGTVGVELNFKADDGLTADGLRLYTINGKGDHIYGFNILQAIMGCLNIKTVTEVNGQAEVWDSGSGKKVMKPVTMHPELMRKPIGLLLQREEYKNSQGEVKSRLNIVMPFTHDKEWSISELQASGGSGIVNKRLATLTDKVLRKDTAPAPIDDDWRSSFEHEAAPEGGNY